MLDVFVEFHWHRLHIFLVQHLNMRHTLNFFHNPEPNESRADFWLEEGCRKTI